MASHEDSVRAEGRSAYSSAGVDIDAANAAVERMKAHIASTRTASVLSTSAGNFGGMYSLADSTAALSEPVLVSSIDGVGTKLKLAYMTGQHRTVAADLVRHCVDDILVQGARPLFFLDYFATGCLEPDVAVAVVAGLSEACLAAHCVLIGGETAEMPGLYAAGEYDLAGCVVGIVDRPRIVTGQAVAEGDVLIGLPSEGLHTNGYSLARRILLDEPSAPGLDWRMPGGTIAEALLAPHRCYAPPVLALLDEHPGLVHGMAHITGGGLLENIPRSLPPGLGALIDRLAWQPQPIFHEIQKRGHVPDVEMFRVFNMGIGYVLIVDARDAGEACRMLQLAGERPAIIGTVRPGLGVTLV